MNTYLLYAHKDWVNVENYFDHQSIVQDLGLKTLFSAAAKGVVKENGEVKTITDADPYLYDIMKRVMIVPLTTEEEIYYRQSVLQDCIDNEEFIVRLYECAGTILHRWDQLGRRANEKAGNLNTATGLVTDIRVLSLFVSGLGQIKKLLTEYHEKFRSEGLKNLYQRICEEFSDEVEEEMNTILKNISFYVDDTEEQGDRKTMKKPKIVLGCGISGGLKFDDFVLQEVSTDVKKYRDPKSTIGKVQNYMYSLTPDSVSANKNTPIQENTSALEYQIVRYITSCCAHFTARFNSFFDQLHLQAAFYRGAVNLKHHLKRFNVDSCFPTVGAQDVLKFDDLKEFVMCIEQRVNAVGNTCDIRNKMLLIVTGANQGGKSTFLRSIGIAQVMMQCGLPVAAVSYQSGIFPSFFTHFTRREDSEMNSGRLDEELGRMSQIIDNLGDASLILLNESFATTTEKEGSVIAYDIIKALNEAGVKILTVTHLLSFAQKVYGETEEAAKEGRASDVEFFCAQRMENGKRTFKMIQHAPELTSFGLDLYNELIKER